MSEIQSKVLNWIATGHVGASSTAMAMIACDLPNDGSYPLDPGDLNRCLLMLEEVPEVRDHFGSISKRGVVWGRLIERWDDIEKSFIEESGLNWSRSKSAPETYKLMKEVIGEEPGAIYFGNGISIRTTN